MTLPFVSVIVPTHRRPDQIRDCLTALAALDYPSERFEVIVVDDGGDFASEEFPAGLNVQVLHRERGGPGAARNSGATIARGELLAFTDDDCRPARDWLRAAVTRWQRECDRDVLAVGGALRNALDLPSSEASQLLVEYLYVVHNTSASDGRFFTTNNLIVPADRFRTLGGFDTVHIRWTGEDRELVTRWRAEGGRLCYEPAALVHHAHPLSLWSLWRQHFAYGRGGVHVQRLTSTRTSGSHALRIGWVRLPGARFFIGALRYPFGVRRFARGRALHLSVLIAVTQVAYAWGFLRELLSTGASGKLTN